MMRKPILPNGMLVRVVSDFSAYPVWTRKIGTVVAYRGLHVLSWRSPEPVHCYTVVFDPPHSYGSVWQFADDEIEPID